MKQSIAHIALVVADYDEAIEFYTEKLGFESDRRHAAVGNKTLGFGRAEKFRRLSIYCLQKPSATNKQAASATKPAGAFFYFYAPTIFGAITKITNRKA